MAIAHDPPNAPTSAGGYSQGLEVTTPGRLLHISGQIPEDATGAVPDTFDGQCAMVWANIQAILTSAGMGVDDLIKVTTFLASREHREANSRIRRQVLGDAAPALTVIITGIYDEQWLLEIEAVAFQAI